MFFQLDQKLLSLVLLSLIIVVSCSKKDDSDEAKASFTFDPTTGNTETIFNFDASSSNNVSQYRWDWNNDGVWDEAYSSSSTKTHKFTVAGNLTVKLEVKDDDGNSNSTTKSIIVDLGPAPSITGKFYLQAKLNGSEWINMQSNNPGYSSGNTMIITLLLPYGVAVDFESTITANKILALNGQTLTYSSPGTHAKLYKTSGGLNFSTGFAPDQAGSEFKVTNVTSDGTYIGKPSYVVEGTFKCKMDDDTHSNYMELTDGRFAIRLFVK